MFKFAISDSLPEFIDPRFAFVLAGIIWVIWVAIIIVARYKGKIDDYFAQKRHDRRVRNYARVDAELTRTIFFDDLDVKQKPYIQLPNVIKPEQKVLEAKQKPYIGYR